MIVVNWPWVMGTSIDDVERVILQGRYLWPTWRKPHAISLFAPAFPFPDAQRPKGPLSKKEDTTPRNEDMGFFSSRKAEDNDTYLTTTTSTITDNDKSVVHVIRSRFVRSGFSSVFH